MYIRDILINKNVYLMYYHKLHYIINFFFIFLFFLTIHKKWITIIFYYIFLTMALSLVRFSIERHCVWPMYAALSRLYNPAFLSVFVVRFSLRSFSVCSLSPLYHLPPPPPFVHSVGVHASACVALRPAIRIFRP